MQVQALPPQAPEKKVLLLLRPQLQVSCACDVVMYIASIHTGAGAASSSTRKEGAAPAATAAAGELCM
jgi:hypothetical protein